MTTAATLNMTANPAEPVLAPNFEEVFPRPGGWTSRSGGSGPRRPTYALGRNSSRRTRRSVSSSGSRRCSMCSRSAALINVW